jgi:hypothetical protein
MKPRVLIDSIDVSSIALVQAFTVQRNSGEAISTATITFQQDMEAGNRFTARAWSEWKPIEIRNAADAADVRFGGLITNIKRTPTNNTRFQVVVTASDFGVLLDRRIVTATWEAASDRTIAKDLATMAAAYGITASDATVAFTATLEAFELKDATLRAGLDKLMEVTGAHWHIDHAKVLHWYKPGTTFAPFNLSDTPNGTTSRRFQMLDFNRDFAEAANRITLVGALLEAGELRVTRDDAASITAYGLLEAIAVDREIVSAAVATIAADAQLADRAHPRVSGKSLVRSSGLKVGQTIGVKAALYGVDANYLITGITERYDGRELAWEIEWGQRPPDIVTVLRRLAETDTSTPVALPAPGSVETVLDDVLADEVAGVITTPAISAIVATTVVGVINAGEAGTVSAGSITGAFNLGTVELHAQDVSGVFISDQLADNIFDSLRLVNRDMQIVERLRGTDTLPALPDVNYPEGSLVLLGATYGQFKYGARKYGSTLYENIADVWTETNAAATMTGLLRARDIQSVSAESITGLIIASQIGSVNAAAITGQITANQIGSVNASAIAAVNASAITGSLSAVQIGGINATTITLVGQWQDSHIAAVSASKLTAGTITALVTMTSPDIQVSGGTYNLTLNNTTGFVATATGTTRTLKLTDAGIDIRGVSTSYYGTMSEAGVQFNHAAGYLSVLSVSSGDASLTLSATAGTWILTTGGGGVKLECAASGAGVSIPSGYLYASQHRFVATTGGPFALPATFTKYIQVYNQFGTLLGNVPVF